MPKSNLRILATGLLLATAFGLSACNETYTELPKAEQDAKILNLDENITHNNLEDLYETIVPHDSNAAEKVLNEILLRSAYTKFGYFYDTTETIKLENGASKTITHKGLNSIVPQRETLSAQAYNELVAAWVANDVMEGDLVYSHTEAYTGTTEEVANKVTDFYNHILEAVKKSFWANTTNTNYQDRNYFVEKEFAQVQFTNLYTLDLDAILGATGEGKRTAIDGSKTYEDVDEYYAAGYLHNYQDYVEKGVLPDIYRKFLTEDYIINNNYTTLGHSYARKIQYIALKDIDGYSLASQRLITTYAEKILEADIDEMSAFAGIALNEKEVNAFRNFHFLDRLYNGTTYSTTVEAAMAKAIYKEALFEEKSFTADDGSTVAYYPATKLGAIYEDYLKGEDNERWATGSTTDFTGAGAYTRDTGLMLKVRETLALNGVTEGWYTSSELTLATSDLKSRLFKIQVANEVDSIDPTKVVDGADDSLNYVCYRQGSYYVVPETRQRPTEGEAYHPYLIYDSASTSWLILRVDEAVKGSKLATSASSSGLVTYDELAKAGRRNGKATQNQIVLTVAGLMGNSDTYAKAAKQEIVKASKMSYHDQSVYDYFAETFPDLFD